MRAKLKSVELLALMENGFGPATVRLSSKERMLFRDDTLSRWIAERLRRGEEKTTCGIIISDTVQKKPVEGEVVAAGEGYSTKLAPSCRST